MSMSANVALSENFCEEGFLVTAPVLTQKGMHTFCKFRILVKTPEGNLYYHITAWGKQAINCFKFLQRGSGVFIPEGNLKEHKVSKDGVNCVYQEVNTERVIFKSNLKNQTEVM